MKRIYLSAKKGGNLSQEELDAVRDEQYDRLDSAEASHSTGVHGQAYEPAVRHQLTVKGILASDCHARTNGNSGHWIMDSVIIVNGIRYKFEIKTGDGIIGYVEAGINPVWTENDILPGIDLVIYCADPQSLRDEADILDKSIVLTRDQFLSYIATEGPKKNKTIEAAVKLGTNDQYLRKLNKKQERGAKYKDCIVLQPQYRSDRKRAILLRRYKTLRQYLREIGR